MADDARSDKTSDKSRGWWQTLPGIITGITGIITALAGLIVAINQTGWLTPRDRPAATAPPAVTAPAAPVGGNAPATAPSATPAPATSTPSAASSTPSTPPPPSTSSSAGSASYAIALPGLREYTLGLSTSGATFTLLAADVSARTAEKAGLRVRVRMMNRSPYPANFWDRSFRLIADGVPTAPEGGLNEVVPGESAKEGEVIFAIARGTAAAKLRIAYQDESTEIPLDLRAPR